MTHACSINNFVSSTQPTIPSLDFRLRDAEMTKKVTNTGASWKRVIMHGSIQTCNLMKQGTLKIKNNHSSLESIPPKNVPLLRQVARGSTMEGSALTHSNANLGCAMMRQRHAKVERRGNPVTTTLSAIETWLVDLVSSGLTRLNVYQWAMLIQDVRQTTTVKSETSAGVNLTPIMIRVHWMKTTSSLLKFA